MLDLAELAIEAERFAEAVRRARCCDALRPCRGCQVLRRHVIARRLVIAHPRRPVRVVHGLAPLPTGAPVMGGTGAVLACVTAIAPAPEVPVPLAS